MRIQLLAACTILGAMGCKTMGGAGSGLQSDSKGYNYAIAQAKEEAATRVARPLDPQKEFATALDLTTGPQSTQTSSFKTKLDNRHDVFLFLKDTNANEDDRRSDKTYRAENSGKTAFQPDDADPLYEAPIHFRFNTNPNIKCDQLVSGNDFASLNKGYFAGMNPQEQKEQLCAVILFRPEDNRPANRAIGDVAQVNLYVSSDYRPWGIDIVQYKTKRDTETKTVALDPLHSVASKLDAVPYDLPNLYILSRMKDAGSKSVSFEPVASLEAPEDAYVRNKLLKSKFKLSGDLCRGSGAYLIRYQEAFGIGPVTAGWCKGDAWPTIVDSHKATTILVGKPE